MADAARARLGPRWCPARNRRRRFPGRVSQSAGGTLSARLRRWSGARSDGGAARPAWTAAIVAPSRAGLRRSVGRDRAGNRGLARGGSRRRSRHIARRRRGRRDPRSAALVFHARALGRDGEPASRLELGARRRADADLDHARPVRGDLGRLPGPDDAVRARARRPRPRRDDGGRLRARGEAIRGLRRARSLDRGGGSRRVRRPGRVRGSRRAAYRALARGSDASPGASGFGAGRSVHRHHRRCDRTLGATPFRNSARAGDRRRRRPVFHLASGSQAARMTSITANEMTLRRGGATLLAGISLALGPTGSVAVVGPNGAGKSMLLKTLAGIEAPTSGQIHIGGTDLARLASADRARTIGYLPQQFEPHWDLCVGDLVRLGAERMVGDVRGAVEQDIESLGLAGVRRRRWATVSGGERARVLLAMVLAVDPPALLADEPAASLDIRHRIDVVQALVRRASDRLSVVVMHDLDLAFRFFDRVVVMDRGRVVADGRAHQIFQDTRLDTTFGVSFERLNTPHHRLLLPTLPR